MTPQELRDSLLQSAFSGSIASRTGTIEGGNKGHNKDPLIPGKISPFDIPESWKWTTLGSCCQMQTGNSISSNEKKSKYEGLREGHDYIGTKDVSFAHTLNYNNGIRIPFTNTDFKLAPKGSVLMCVEGGSAGRKIAITDRDVCFGNKLCMFKTVNEDLYNSWIYFYLQSPEFKKLFSKNMTGIIGGVSIKKLKNIPIPIAPRGEQDYIISKIEELIPLCDRYEKAYDYLQTLDSRFPSDIRKSILQEAIQGRLVEQRPEEGTGEELYCRIEEEKERLVKEGKVKKEKPLPEVKPEEEPFEIPGSWKWVRLGEIVNIKMGQSPRGSSVSKNGDGIEFHQGKVLFGKKYIGKSLQKTSSPTTLAEPNSVLLSVRAPVGKVNIANRSICIGRGLASLSCLSGVRGDFIYYLLSAYEDVFSKQATGTTFTEIGRKVIADQLVPLPPTGEQKRIASKLEELMPLLDRFQEKGKA
ncbi:MAG: restriction endonuclease subunit S [Aeriscardovia sp.]|nr:restriction endonuclease subunit S [Aeriscardovia sp.]